MRLVHNGAHSVGTFVWPTAVRALLNKMLPGCRHRQTMNTSKNVRRALLGNYTPGEIIHNTPCRGMIVMQLH